MNTPHIFPKIPTTTDADYHSADVQTTFQVIDVYETNVTQKKNKYMCVVKLMDSKSSAIFSILVGEETRHGDTQYISDGQTYPYVLSALQNQLAKYELSEEGSGDELATTLGTVFGDPSICILG